MPRSACPGAAGIPRADATASPHWVHQWPVMAGASLCPAVNTTAAPATFPVALATKLVLRTKGLPPPLAGSSYYCVARAHGQVPVAVEASLDGSTGA